MKTRNRLISALLTLALLCPMLTFMLPLEADAALVPDDGVKSTSSSNSIYEEWNFDDLADGANVTKGYINSHINGSFDASLFSGTWKAVTDAETGRKYITSSNDYFKLNDPELLLLNNPYEVSFDMLVDPSSDNTDTSLLLWCNDGVGGEGARYALLRYSPSEGNIGYYTTSATSSKTGEQFEAINAAPKGEWHNIRARISPATGVVILWVDGEYRFQYVNEYLKANAASSAHSALFIWYTWNSTRTICLDNIKLTELKIDETLEFMPEIPATVGGSWDFESDVIKNGAGITATLGSDSAHIGKKSDVGNDTGMYYLDSKSNSTSSGLHYAFGEPLYNFETVTVSYRARYASVASWTNMFIFKNASKTEKVLLRVNAVPATSSASQLDWRDQSDKQTATDGTIKANIWYTFNLEVLPHKGLVNVTVTPDADSGETAWSFTATRTDIKDLCDSGNVLSFYIYRQSGIKADVCIDDVKITTSRFAVKDVSGSWDFDSKSLASADGLSAPVTSDMEYVADPSVKVAEGETATDYVLHTKYTSGTNNSPYGPDMTFGGRLKEYESITISFKIYYAAASNWTNVIRFKNASGAQKPLLRVGSYSNGLGLAYRNGTTYINSKGETVDNQYGTYNGSTAAKLTKDAWNDISVTITPSTGDFTVSLNGTALRATSGGSTTFNNVLIKELYDNNKSLSFQLYYHSKMQASTYFDDLEVEAKLVEGDTATELKERLNAEFVDPAFSVVNPDSTSRSYSEWEIAENESNYVLQTNTDKSTASTLAIKDSQKYLARQPFEVSFDYCVNQVSGYINLMRLNMNGTWFSIWRVTNQYGVTHYTSTPYAKTVIPSSTSGYNLPPNVTSVSKLTQGQWYNVRTVINPLNGHIMCYWDNVLVSDYNINDVFIDESGASLDVCGANESKRDNVIIELAAAVGVSVVNSSFDNVRIRTLERHEYTKTCIGNADFDDLTAGSALTADSFMLTSGGIYTTAVNGGFTVEGGELGNYLAADVVAGNSIDIGLTTDYNPLAAGVVAFEGNFNLKSFGTEGTLDLLSLVRDGGNTLPLLKVDTDGKLYMGTETNAVYTLKSGELYNVKLLMSGASGLLTLYINGKLVTAGVSMGITSAPNLTYKDDMNNTYVFNNQRFESYFAYGEDGAQRKTFSGLDLYEAATYDFTAIAWPNDTLKLLGATGAGTWQVIADDISLTRDEYADLYYNNYENISRLHGMSSSVYGSYVASMKYADETVDNVTNGYATMSGTTGGGRVGFWDNNSMLWGRDFVAQMDFRLNSIPDSLYYNLFTFVTGAAPDAITTWGSLLRIDSEGNLYKPEQEGGAYVSLGKQIPKEEWVNIAVAVSVNPWGNPTRSNDYMVRSVLVKVYVGREVVDTYVAIVTSHLFDSLLRFCVESANNAIDIDVDNTRVYYGTSRRNNDEASDGSGIKFEGYNALTIDFEKESFFDEAQLNAIDYVDWRYSALGTTLTDLNDATVTISEKVTKDDNSFFRIRRPSFNNKPVAYMDYNLGTMGDYGEIYSIEMDIRYTDTLGHSMDVVELFERNLTGSLVLLSILGTNDDYSNTYYFENDGIRYYLCDKSGALLHVNPAGDGEFSEIGLVVNETEGYYSIWIDGQNAYYRADGGTSGEVVSVYKVPLEYEKQPSATVCDPVARLLRATDNSVTNSIIDIDNISIDVIKNGMAPVLYGEQVLNVGGAVRFVATVDTLYSNAVGFEVVANSNGAVSESGNTDKNSPVVYSSIWEESGKGLNKVTADELGGRYIAVMTVTGIIDTAEYTFVITPYVYLFGEKVYGDAKTITYNHVKAGEAE